MVVVDGSDLTFSEYSEPSSTSPDAGRDDTDVDGQGTEWPRTRISAGVLGTALEGGCV